VSTANLSKREVLELANKYMLFLESWFYKRHKIAYKIMRLFDFIRFQKSKL